MTLKILVSRHSAFYSPLLAAITGGFLKGEGLEATYGVLGTGQTSRSALIAQKADIVQSAVSTAWAALEKGETNLPVHFAQINQRDGFFLVGRQRPFAWEMLDGAELLADNGFQPLAMLRYAAHYNGVDWESVNRSGQGSPEEIASAFRSGQGDFVHLQSPAAHELEIDGVGYVVASVGGSMPEVAFSSLCALPDFPASSPGQAFLRAYRKAREWVRSAPPADVAAVEASLFPDHPAAALEAAIHAYQQIGCWEGGVEIPGRLYDQALEVFLHSGKISRRHRYEEVAVSTTSPS